MAQTSGRQRAMQGLIQIIRTLKPTQLALIGGATLALIASFAWLIIETGAPRYELLSGDLDLTDASRVVSFLDTAKIPHRIGTGGNSITVPADQVGRARVALAERGLPAGGSLGYEIFDRSDGLTTTNFQQNVNLVRALEGELARSIRAIETVRSARVHLVMPKRELFSRETPPPSASVLLLMRSTTRLTPPQVLAVQHLITSAVPGLVPERISIIDARGSLLTTNRESADGDTEILDHVERTLRTEFMTNLARTSRRDSHEHMAEIFNSLDRATESRLMATLEECSHESAERIKQLMFTFEDLVRIDASGIQLLLRQIQKEQLAIALKGASEQVRAVFLSNMSERAGKMLQEDIAALGPIRIRDVDEAQSAIVATAKMLADANEITIVTSNEPDQLVY